MYTPEQRVASSTSQRYLFGLRLPRQAQVWEYAPEQRVAKSSKSRRYSFGLRLARWTPGPSSPYPSDRPSSAHCPGRRKARHANILQTGLQLAIAQAVAKPAMPIYYIWPPSDHRLLNNLNVLLFTSMHWYPRSSLNTAVLRYFVFASVKYCSKAIHPNRTLDSSWQTLLQI